MAFMSTMLASGAFKTATVVKYLGMCKKKQRGHNLIGPTSQSIILLVLFILFPPPQNVFWLYESFSVLVVFRTLLGFEHIVFNELTWFRVVWFRTLLGFECCCIQ